ncbi:hypothetical protein N0V90_009311 [Kalmusia sp. IMI 367209]|nr:hypothetical protein N0V90_009311 [Kalmusia sp. IMI 367209]
MLHRFINSSWKILSSQTIGVEFASKIVHIQPRDPSRGPRKRIKLQLWDTAGTERFRSVSRSYYRGAAGAILVYDVSSWRSFEGLRTFLEDVRALASPDCTIVLAGNKMDVAEGGATYAPDGREVPFDAASRWAGTNGIPVAVEVSALSGENVDELFNRLARMILTKIELGEIDPDDPQSGIQYGDIGGWGLDDGGSVRSGRERGRRGQLREWEEVFRLSGSSGRRRVLLRRERGASKGEMF